MRAMAGSGNPSDLPPSEHDRHLHMMSRLAGGAHAGTPALNLILRAASSGPAKALIAMKDDLARAGMSARAILAKLEPEADIRQLFATLSALAPNESPATLIRWARNPRLHDAHEQAAYGETMCWLGDAMRRDADKRNALTLFHEDAPDRTRLTRLSFMALWAVSAPVPQRYLRGDAVLRPSGEYERPPEARLAVSPLPPSPQGWPLIRH